MKATMFEQLLADRRAKRPVAVVTRLADGEEALVHEEESESENQDGVSGALALTPEQLAETRQRLRADRSGALASADGALFARCHVSAPRLVIVGAVDIAPALAPMAAIAGDPRRAFATPQRLPGVSVTTEWPDEALERLGIDAQTAVVTLSHDPKLDDPALIVALQSDAFYIGSLGSTRTHAKRVARLAEAGLEEAIARIHAPVGLDLGGRAPAEIAVAILAQVVQARHRAR